MASEYFEGMKENEVAAVLGEPFACVSAADGEVRLYSHEGAGIHSIQFHDGMAKEYDFLPSSYRMFCCSVKNQTGPN